jgi:hypothetical protein
MTETENQWTEVWSCAWLHEAQFFKSLLEDAGIEVLLPDEYTLGVDPGLAPGFGGVRILVRADDVSQAREILEATSKQGSQPDTERD